MFEPKNKKEMLRDNNTQSNEILLIRVNSLKYLFL